MTKKLFTKVIPKNKDGTFSNPIPVGAKGENVIFEDGKDLETKVEEINKNIEDKIEEVNENIENVTNNISELKMQWKRF